MKLKSILASFVGLAACLSPVHTFADNNSTGGISLGATRVIYPLGAKQIPLTLLNHSDKDRFLINSWIENQDESKSTQFLITPPLFVIEPKNENILRIIAVDQNFPADRESVYWVNVKAIPSTDRESLADKNVLQIAVLSRIKLFVRPNNLPYKSELAPEKIKFNLQNQGVSVNNPTPYYVNLVNIHFDGHKVNNTMLAPFSTTSFTEKATQRVTYQSINDFGGLSEQKEQHLE